MKVEGKHRRPTVWHDGSTSVQDRISKRRRKRCPGCNVAGLRVDRKEAREANREVIRKVANRASRSINNENLSRWNGE